MKSKYIHIVPKKQPGESWVCDVLFVKEEDKNQSETF